MKISKLISKLKTIKDKDGDLEILIREDGMGGYSMSTCYIRDVEELHTFRFESMDDLPIETLKEIYPDWDGEEESFDKLESVKVVVIGSDVNLYST